MGPQQLNDEPHTHKADVWALGIVALECAGGHHPYLNKEGKHSSSGILDLIQRVTSGPPPTAEGMGLSAEFESFVMSCLKMEEEDRHSAEELLNHPFIVTHKHPDAQFRFSSWLSGFKRPDD